MTESNTDPTPDDEIDGGDEETLEISHAELKGRMSKAAKKALDRGKRQGVKALAEEFGMTETEMREALAGDVDPDEDDEDDQPTKKAPKRRKSSTDRTAQRLAELDQRELELNVRAVGAEFGLSKRATKMLASELDTDADDEDIREAIEELLEEEPAFAKKNPPPPTGRTRTRTPRPRQTTPAAGADRDPAALKQQGLEEAKRRGWV